MKLKISELKNIAKNEYLSEKVEIILKEFNDEKNDNNEKLYVRCAAVLEFINVKLLRDHFQVKMPDFSIVRIMEEYAERDEKLFDLMATINGNYNTVDMHNIEDDDIINLLYQIDFIYKNIVEKYGDVI